MAIYIPKDPKVSYAGGDMASLAKEYHQVIESIDKDNRYANLFESYKGVLRDDRHSKALKDFFVSNIVEEADPTMSIEKSEKLREDYELMFSNIKEDILKEHTATAVYNPMAGLSLPMYKQYMINSIYENVIPSESVNNPIFSCAVEKRVLIDPVTRREYDFFTEQHLLTDVILGCVEKRDVFFTVPQTEADNDILTTVFGKTGNVENLSTATHVSGLVGTRLIMPQQEIKIAVSRTVGTETVIEVIPYTNRTIAALVAGTDVLPGVTGTVIGGVFPYEEKFKTSYGAYNLTLTNAYEIPVVTAVAAGTVPGSYNLTTVDGTVIQNAVSEKAIPKDKWVKGYISATMNKNKFMIMTSDTTNTLGVVMFCKIDMASATQPTPTVKWTERTHQFRVPDAYYSYSITTSNDELADVAALYNIDQMSKIMQMVKDSDINTKDDMIKMYLDDSYVSLPDNMKIGRTFTCKENGAYAHGPKAWVKEMFMMELEAHIGKMGQMLNDPDMVYNIVGRKELIMRLAPELDKVTYVSQASVGPIKQDFMKVITNTSTNTQMTFVAADKMRDTNNLIIIPIPKSDNRFVYKLFNYIYVLTNKVRNPENSQLENMYCYSRWLLEKLQPFQGRVTIKDAMMNPRYASEHSFSNDPLGRGDGSGTKSVGLNDLDIDKI